MRRIGSFFPRPGGLPCVDGRRMISGTGPVIRHAMQRKDAPTGHGRHKALTSRLVRRSRLGVFPRIRAALASQDDPPSS